MLLGLLRVPEGVAAQGLTNLDLKLEDVRKEVFQVSGSGLEAYASSVVRLAQRLAELINEIEQGIQGLDEFRNKAVKQDAQKQVSSSPDDQKIAKRTIEDIYNILLSGKQKFERLLDTIRDL